MNSINIPKAVCVVIPAYNCGDCIEKCVNSYVEQTYELVHIIVVNDGSTDDTEEVCKRLLKKHTQIIFINQDNAGVSAARNRGIEEAEKHGYKYMFFADSDDYAEPGLIEKCVSVAEKSGIEFVITGYFFETIDNGGNIVSIENSYPNTVYKTKDEIKDDFTHLWDAGMLYNIWNKLFLLDVISKGHIRFPAGKAFNEDRDFVRDYLRHTTSLAVISECLYHYNRADDAATGIYRPDFFNIRREEYVRLKDFFEEYGVTDDFAYEFLARQHTDRVVGVVENMFHDKERTTKKIKRNIKVILKDKITFDAFRIAKPKSKKMKILTWPYKINWIGGIYLSTALIYYVKKKNPELFHKLRQAR